MRRAASAPRRPQESSQGWGGDYTRDTREHYRDGAVARQYARALGSMWSSPTPSVLAALERRAIRRGLQRLGTEWGAKSVLDLPAGTGKLSAMLGTHMWYLAADVSEEMLAFAPAAAPKLVADALCLPLRSHSLDRAVCLRLYHRVPTKVLVPMMREVIRVARDGAVVSYSSQARFPQLHRLIRRVARRPDANAQILSPAELASLVRQAGGVIISDRSISGGLTAERVATMIAAGGGG